MAKTLMLSGKVKTTWNGVLVKFAVYSLYPIFSVLLTFGTVSTTGVIANADVPTCITIHQYAHPKRLSGHLLTADKVRVIVLSPNFQCFALVYQYMRLLRAALANKVSSGLLWCRSCTYANGPSSSLYFHVLRVFKRDNIESVFSKCIS
jgi:hypothetical protein